MSDSLDKIDLTRKERMLPQEPGDYFWYILDLMSYFEIGSVHVTKDPEKHLEYLRGVIKEGKDRRQFYIYQNDKGETLTMFHDASNSHVPPADENAKPYVDGYIPYDFKELLSKELKYGEQKQK